ncbi:MAG: hypothetical protein KME08_12095 [Aphanothece sp. CMT-3BRIN-NPC111]|jgi:hypothetical protein|nr:hypothetical protein [Aphanothece sp. CMT-3BRIN-NPC111]
MGRKIGFWLLWLGFIAYVLLLAPPVKSDTAILIKNLLTGQWAEINPIILSLFSLVGIWLQIYACLMFFDGRMQKIRAWHFLLASVATGVIGLLPYLALRESNQEFSGRKDALLKLVDSRQTGVILGLSTIGLLAYGLLAGNWGDFIQQFQTSRFINGMSLAFCLFCLLFPALLGDDMARRGLKNPQVFWAVALMPLFGPLTYLCLRPPLLEEPSADVLQTQKQLASK